MLRPAFLLLALLFSRLAVAVLPEDTLMPRLSIPWFTEEQLQSPFDAVSNYIDTTITGFQHYDFAHKAGFFFANKGNVGHATRLLEFNPLSGHNFQLDGGGLFPGYRLTHSKLKFYRPNHVFTDVFY